MSVDTLKLDARQRAMLGEMGVKVWWPSTPVATLGRVAEDPSLDGAIKTVAVSARGAGATERFDADIAIAPASPLRLAPSGAATAAQPSAMRPHAPTPRGAPLARPSGLGAGSALGAEVQVEAPQRLYGGAGAAHGGWLIVADMQPEADGHHGEVFEGDAGRLLQNMLRALQLHAGAVPVHLARAHRGAPVAPDSGRATSGNCAEQIKALAPRVVLLMGPFAARALLGSTEPVGKQRGRVVWQDGLPMVVTYHPGYLLRNAAHKARAWADLCLAAAEFERVS